MTAYKDVSAEEFRAWLKSYPGYPDSLRGNCCAIVEPPLFSYVDVETDETVARYKGAGYEPAHGYQVKNADSVN